MLTGHYDSDRALRVLCGNREGVEGAYGLKLYPLYLSRVANFLVTGKVVAPFRDMWHSYHPCEYHNFVCHTSKWPRNPSLKRVKRAVQRWNGKNKANSIFETNTPNRIVLSESDFSILLLGFLRIYQPYSCIVCICAPVTLPLPLHMLVDRKEIPRLIRQHFVFKEQRKSQVIRVSNLFVEQSWAHHILAELCLFYYSSDW